MLVLQKNPLPVEQKLEMYLSNSTLPTYLSHSNSVIFRMVPESTSMEMEQKQESDCTKVLVHSSDSVVQQNLVLSTFLHRFQHSSSSVEILEKEKPMHIKVLVHSSDSILQQKSELLLQNFLVSSRFRVQVQKQKPRYLLVLVHSTSIQRGMGSMFLASKFISVLQNLLPSTHQKKLKYSPSLVLQLQKNSGHTLERVPLRIYRSSRIQRSFTRFYGTLQGSGFWRRIQKQNLHWNGKSIWIYWWSRSNCCYRKCTRFSLQTYWYCRSSLPKNTIYWFWFTILVYWIDRNHSSCTTSCNTLRVQWKFCRIQNQTIPRFWYTCHIPICNSRKTRTIQCYARSLQTCWSTQRIFCSFWIRWYDWSSVHWSIRR